MVAGSAEEGIAFVLIVREVKMPEELVLAEALEFVGVIERAVAYRHQNTLSLKTRLVERGEVI